MGKYYESFEIDTMLETRNERIAALEAENKRLHSLNLAVTKKAWETESDLAAARAQLHDADELHKWEMATYKADTERQIETERRMAEAENAKLRAALEAVEWVHYGSLFRCPWCKRYEVEGHADNCARQVALGLAKTE